MRVCPNCQTPNRDTARFCRVCGAEVSPVAQVGTLLGGEYRVVSILKSGGMGTVYKAESGRHLYALKEMLDSFPTPAARQDGINRFMDEALILARLNHQYIPKVHRNFVENGRYYLVMDFIQGEDFETVLAQKGSQGLAQEAVIGWALQVCDVLAYLHSLPSPIIFRDLKPANLMLTSGGQVNLVDFGIARLFNPARQGTLIGTPGYAAPEQYQGLAEPRSDIFSLGATLHHLLTGRDPQNHLPFSFPLLRQVDPSLSAELEAIVAKALTLEMAGRYQSVREVQDALQNIQGIFDLRVDHVHPKLYMRDSPVAQVMLTITSKDTVGVAHSQVSAHICLLLDVSGSMFTNDQEQSVRHEKYDPLRRAVQHLIDELPEHYWLTIVIFAAEAELICALEPVQACQRRKGELLHAIDNSPLDRSQTCLAKGLDLIREPMQALQRPGIVHRLCLLTDGQLQDATSCRVRFDEIRTSPIEVYAYGFGADWAKEPLWSMVEPCRGGSFKPVSAKGEAISAYDIEDTFGRFALAGRNIVATDAKLWVAFAQDAIPKDGFRYQPIARYLGDSFCDPNQIFQTTLGSLQVGLSYSYCFEIRLPPSQQAMQQLGVVTLRYTHQGQKFRQTLIMMVQRTPDKREAEQIVMRDVQEAFLILESLRTTDPQKLLRSYKARIDMLLSINGDPRQIQALQTAVQELQKRGNLNHLSQEDQLWIGTDSRGGTISVRQT